MDAMTNLLTRRSVRAYRFGQKIPKEKLESILKAGMYAPSAMHKSPWAFVVIQDPQKLEEITHIHPHAHFVTEAGCAIVVCADKSAAYEDYWCVDPLLAAQNILLAAHAEGLGACWCGVYPTKERMAAFSILLSLPAHIQPMALIALGVPKDEAAQPKDQFNPTLIHQEQW